MKYPLISIAIATYNSEKTIKATLESIKKQTYPKSKIETLIIDGGSTDQTVKIAKRYHVKIISNLKTELIYAKYLGFYQAKGEYLIFIDSDEVFISKNSLKIKLISINKIPRIRAVMLGGYQSPKYSSQINNYINEFGDPFSFFVYRESKGSEYLIPNFAERFFKQLKYQDKDCLVIDFKNTKSLPLIELWAGGSMIDLVYAKKHFSQIKKNPGLLAHLFYLINNQGGLLALSKNDFTLHDSVPNLNKYLKKLVSRVKNNIFVTDMGKGGFTGRDNYQSSRWFKWRRYMFILYSLSIIWPMLDGFYLFFTRQKKIYLLHPLLTWYTLGLISYYWTIKSIGFKLEIGHYGR